jgi:hypothetical protein
MTYENGGMWYDELPSPAEVQAQIDSEQTYED